MSKKKKLFIKGCLVLSFLLSVILLSSCLSLLTSNTDPIIPDGMSVDINDSAVISGPIGSVDQYPVSSYLTQKTLRVPAGKVLTFEVRYSISVQKDRSYRFFVNQSVSLPALENGKAYRLYSEQNDDFNSILLIRHIKLTLIDLTTNDKVFSDTLYFNPPIRPNM